MIGGKRLKPTMTFHLMLALHYNACTEGNHRQESFDHRSESRWYYLQTIKQPIRKTLLSLPKRCIFNTYSYGNQTKVGIRSVKETKIKAYSYDVQTIIIMIIVVREFRQFENTTLFQLYVSRQQRTAFFLFLF